MTTSVQIPPTGATGTAQHARPLVPYQAKPPKHRTSAQVSRAEKTIASILLVVGSIIFLVPFYFVVNASLKTEAEVNAGEFVAPPKSLGLDAFKRSLDDAARARHMRSAGGAARGPQGVSRPTFDWTKDLVPGTIRYFEYPLRNYPRSLAPDKLDFWPALANTTVITTLSVIGQVISCSLVGFGFARFKFRGRGALFMVMLSTLMLPAQVVMIPVFILFRSLGMIDTFWPLIIPMWLASPFFVFMFRQFFAQIPEDLIEAARIDGAGNWRIYWQLMLPLSGPVIAIVSIYTFLAAWNDFLGPLIYLNSPENRTIALALNAFRGEYGVSDLHLLMAAAVVCMLPCVILFFAAQKYFVESVAMTGLKN